MLANGPPAGVLLSTPHASCRLSTLLLPACTRVRARSRHSRPCSASQLEPRHPASPRCSPFGCVVACPLDVTRCCALRRLTSERHVPRRRPFRSLLAQSALGFACCTTHTIRGCRLPAARSLSARCKGRRRASPQSFPPAVALLFYGHLKPRAGQAVRRLAPPFTLFVRMTVLEAMQRQHPFLGQASSTTRAPTRRIALGDGCWWRCPRTDRGRMALARHLHRLNRHPK